MVCCCRWIYRFGFIDIMEKRSTFLILGLLFSLGLYLRISGTFKGDFAFTFDQGRDFLVVRDIVYQHDLRLIGPPSGIEGVFHGVWWYWLLAPVFLVFDGDPTAVVATFNLFGNLAILLGFWLGKLLKGLRAGI